MMTSNNQTNNTIKWLIIAVDFVLLNLLVWLFVQYHFMVKEWPWEMKWVFLFTCNLALMLSEVRFSTVVHQRMVTVSDILQRVVGLALGQALIAYILLKCMSVTIPAGIVLLMLLPPFLALLMITRFLERWAVKRIRKMGRNSRSVTFVGNDPELMSVYEKLINDQTRGYRFLGYYADDEMGKWTHSTSNASSDMAGQDMPASLPDNSEESKGDGKEVELVRLGTLQDFLGKIETAPDELQCGDEIYVCLSRRDREIINRISLFCDHKVIRFYYLPVSVESMGINLKREMLDDIEVYTTYEIPLANPVNKFVKRTFDIVASLVFLIPTAILFPFIYVIIKTQSPGPIFFRQKRTGLDGRDFDMLKFRSMHVNADADKLQATKDDPRKYPFGNFMRKSNIDELPQFLNVLKGDMSFVGPRPHMLLHTEQYSQLIDKYMVRHFVKPGLTGWAQVTGFRGETKELWQMEGRVKRDIWYIEHWSIWLDIRIIWMTFKTIFIHDKNAY